MHRPEPHEQFDRGHLGSPTGAMPRRSALLFVIILLIAALGIVQTAVRLSLPEAIAAIAATEPEPVPEPTSEPEPPATPEPSIDPIETVAAEDVRPAPSPEPPPAPLLSPLTGLPLVDQDDPDAHTRPVVLVKIENSKKARPQTGLDAADIVYEQLVEYGVTRFMVLFQSVLPERIGPVRSGRLVDTQVAPAHEPIFAYSGARPDVNASLRRAGLALVVDDDDGFPFYRISERRAPHNLYADVPTLLEVGRDKRGVGPATAPFTFDASDPHLFGCGPASALRDDPLVPPGPAWCPRPVDEVRVVMSRISAATWTWDDESGTWSRQFNGEPHLVTGEGAIAPANVLLLGMRVGRGGCCDVNGASFVATTATGTGSGWLLRDGVAIPLVWEKDTKDDHYVLRDETGVLLRLRPGRTWVHLMPRENLPEIPQRVVPADDDAG